MIAEFCSVTDVYDSSNKFYLGLIFNDSLGMVINLVNGLMRLNEVRGKERERYGLYENTTRHLIDLNKIPIDIEELVNSLMSHMETSIL